MPLIKVTGVTSDDMEVAHSTAEINGQLLVKRKMMFHTAKPQIQPIYISN
jgi:hypothetical protein